MRSVAKNNHLKTKQAIDMNTITSKIITMLLLLFALSACGSDKKQKAENQQVSEEEQQVSEEDLPFVDPSMVAEDFFLSIYLGDKMGVKQHCTNQVWDYIRDKKFMEGAIRFSFSNEITKKDLDFTLKVLKDSIEMIRRVI